MWIPKRTPGGVPGKIAVSIFSLVAIHAAVIVLHIFLDEATPAAPVAYVIDRGMEWGEKGWSRLAGTQSHIKRHLALATERMEELDTLIEEGHLEQGHMTILLRDGLYSLERAMQLSHAYVERDATKVDIVPYTKALFVESSISDTIKRLRKMQEHVEDEAMQQSLLSAAERCEQLLAYAEGISGQYELDEEVKEEVRTDVVNQIRQMQEEPAPLCAEEYDVCEEQADCCGLLECTPVINAQGARVRRCLTP